jgi:hypothetical protein
MFSFTANSVNDALRKGLRHLLDDGVVEDSRNGPVLVAPGPVCTEYVNPRARVLYSPTRDANPFFHLFESLWMLSGANDIEFPCYFAKSYGQYSDDGKTMWDAYGYRWRQFFGWDQLEALVTELKANPASRRCVLAMWNAGSLLNRNGQSVDGPIKDDFFVATNGGKAVPCNTHAYFDLRYGVLNMTVCNRSNDAVFGCYGANAVHFSFLQEYAAARVGAPVGVYRQFSNNLHMYTDVHSRAWAEQVITESDVKEDYTDCPPISGGFDEDLKIFMIWAREVIRGEQKPGDMLSLYVPDMKTNLMGDVAVPMFLAWYYRKQKDEYSMNICLDGIDAPDWQKACREWVERRRK